MQSENISAKRLRDQGLPVHYLDLVFHAIVVSRILYALPVWGSRLSSEQINRINTLFKDHIAVALLSKL